MWKKQRKHSRRLEQTVILCGRFCAVCGVLIIFLVTRHSYQIERRERFRIEEPVMVWKEAQAQSTDENHIEEENPMEISSVTESESVTEEMLGKDIENDIGNEIPWDLILVNPWTPLPEDFTVVCVELKDGQAVDERCYPELQSMMDDCRQAGLSPYICSSFRTYEKQVRLFEENVAELRAQGYTEEAAREKTAESIAKPGTSEHQSGLAVDIVDIEYQVLDEKQEETRVQQWLIEHSWEYGFILRYPSDKSDITGITYEPWHYRYVGRETAERIHAENLCLEEYYEKYLLP